ncbi:MAG: holo-ACP synthase [Clostridiales bacterium]|nr:holo-ACP synthase [Clostridiales bacterium]
MVYGIGADIIEISRFKKTALRQPGILRRLFTQAELDYCLKKADPYPSLAVRFAAKEAVIKIFARCGQGFDWHDVEITNAPGGDPHVTLYGKLAALAAQERAADVLITLSHSQDMALAYALAQSSEK